MNKEIDPQVLADLFAADTDGLLDTPIKPPPVTADSRLEKGFLEIVEFYRAHGREPSSSTRDIAERKLGARLDGFRATPERAQQVRAFDEFGLLDAPEIDSLDDLLAEDDLDLLDSDADIFDLSGLPEQPAQPRSADEVAKRTKAEDFEVFRPLFAAKHAELQEGTWQLIPFRGLSTIKVGTFFVLGGVMAFVAEVGETEFKPNGDRERPKERLRVVFENGTESSMYRQSFSIRLYEQNGRAVVRTGFDASEIGDADQETGHIYVLRSLSEDPQIAALDDLYKIGFSTTSVDQRVADAAKEPTYLMAPVEVIADYRAYNLRPSALEHLLHRVFAASRLQVSQVGPGGRTYNPSEWFIAPLRVINQAVDMIMTGDIVEVVYDRTSQRLVPIDNR
ncbi:MAG: GIY-YIG nuclease family protein [Corynebacterium sp.]|uniref:GIY-YIG nuclease family protein n=1 Tax=Corynebacterium sp. TaxID=1720 RepID=UPI0026DF6616|nr:GIY-YIG nuclease family protein [Corynebacterium sp.]MDO5668625.1 GIY-YIG nuclease family protein [Corynebacterium sp.]